MRTDIAEAIGFTYIKNKLECMSPYGEMLIKELKPYQDKPALIDELSNISRAIKALSDQDAVSRLFRLLMPLKDIRRSVQHIGEGALDEVELFEIKRFLLQLREIIPAYEKTKCVFLGVAFPELSKALDLLCIDGNCTAGFYISDKYSEALRDIRNKKREIELKIRSANSSDIDNLKIERLITVDAESREEAKIRRELSEALLPYKGDIEASIDMLGRVDLVFAKARLADKYNASCPQITDDMCVEFKQMINPYIADALQKSGMAFTPVSIFAGSGSCVITGANMGGKSVALKTLALNTYCALCGMFVFAEQGVVPMLECISLICEDSEDTEGGLSSFGGEMLRLSDELKNADSRAMLLFDELARGTNPQEGARIMRALVKYLNNKKAICVLTTHYDGVSRLAKRRYRVIGLKDFDFDSVKGRAGALAVAQSMNYGLYEAPNDDECPKEAIGICKMLLGDSDFLKVLLEEE